MDRTIGCILLVLLVALAIRFCQPPGGAPPDITAGSLAAPAAAADGSGADAGKQRLNIVFLGIEGGARSDTIMFASLDCRAGRLDIISIPRDTYYCENGYDKGDQRKLNARYGRGGERGSAEAVSYILDGAAVDYYVSVDYEAVRSIVDILGGIELEVPFDMEVGGIELKAGRQMLNGNQALQFVRFRKSYANGDLGRMAAQQQFLKAVLDKLTLLNLPEVIRSSYRYVKTDMSLGQMLYYGLKLSKLQKEDIHMVSLPGTAAYREYDGRSWSYFFYDAGRVQALMDGILGGSAARGNRRSGALYE